MFTSNQAVIYQYSMTTPWSLATASYDSLNFSASAQGGDNRDIFFKPDGTKFWTTPSALYEYSMSSPWNISTATYSAITLAKPSQIGGLAVGLNISPDGSYFYLLDSHAPDAVYQFSMGATYSGTGRIAVG